MTNESRETQELRKIPGWATKCVVMSLTEQEAAGRMGQRAATLCSCPRALDIFPAYSMSQLLLSALAGGCNMLGLQSDSSREPAVEFCAGALGIVLGPRLCPISQDPK